MIIEDLTAGNALEQLENDALWIQEIICHKGNLYSHSDKIKALALSHFLGENQDKLRFFIDYAMRRDDLLYSVNHNDGSETQTELFEGGEC